MLWSSAATLFLTCVSLLGCNAVDLDLQSGNFTSNGLIFPVCAGEDAGFYWNYTLDAGESVQDIQWFFSDGRSDEMIAFYAAGNFAPMPAFSGRVSFLGDAGIEIHSVTSADAGNYTVQISAHHTLGTFATVRHQAILLVAESPPKSNGSLTASVGDQAVLDNVTGEYRVQLSCGKLTDLGQPPVTIEWRTPSGATLPSTSSADGEFYLLLDNPVEGGTYSCALSPSVTLACLPDHDPLSDMANVTVDEVKARLSVMEAQQTGGTVDVGRNDIDLPRQLDDMKIQLDNLTHYVRHLETLVTKLQESSSRQASFHATLSADTQFLKDQPMALNITISNDGGAYSPATGTFIAPFNGTYFFIASSDVTLDVAVYWYMMVDSHYVCAAESRYGNAVSTGNERATCFVTQHLSKGQRVWLKSGATSTFWGHTYFSGALVSADL